MSGEAIERGVWRSLLGIQVALAAVVIGLRAWVHWAGLDARLANSDVYYVLYFAFEPAAAALLVIAVALAFLARGRFAPAGWDAGGRAWPWAAALFAAVAWAGLVWVVRCYPLSRDESCLLFQARIFAGGKIVAPVATDLIPALWPASPQFLVTHSAAGFWHSMYWPGFSLLLAPFAGLGAPELLNPLVGGATILVAWAYFRARGFSGGALLGAMSLLLCGAGVWCMAMTYYAFPAHALLNLLFAWLLLRPGARRAVAAGAVGSLALCLHQFVPHALFALPWCVGLLRARDWRRLGWLACGYAPLSLLLGVGWFLLTAGGDAHCVSKLSLGRVAAALASGNFDVGMSPPSGAALLMQVLPLTQVLLWSAPAVAALAIAGWRLGGWGDEERRWAWALAVTLVFYAFVPYTPGHGWGYRYAFPVWLAPVVLGASAFRLESGARFVRAALATGLVAIALLLPYRMWQMGSFIRGRLAPLEAVADWRGIVFVDPDGGWYHEDYIANDPFLRNRPLFLFSRGEAADAAVAKALGLPARDFPDAP